MAVNLASKAVVVATALAIAYPGIVYFGVQRFGVTALAAFLLGIVLLRLILSGNWRSLRGYPLPLAIAALCLLSITLSNLLFVKFYPVLMNLSVAAVFAVSLTQPETFIEKLAVRFKGDEAKRPEARHYMRNLTAVWVFVLLANAAVATLTALYASTQVWALYNGVISYVLMAVLFIGEVIFRGFYKRGLLRHQTVKQPIEH